MSYRGCFGYHRPTVVPLYPSSHSQPPRIVSHSPPIYPALPTTHSTAVVSSSALPWYPDGPKSLSVSQSVGWPQSPATIGASNKYVQLPSSYSQCRLLVAKSTTIKLNSFTNCILYVGLLAQQFLQGILSLKLLLENFIMSLLTSNLINI